MSTSGSSNPSRNDASTSQTSEGSQQAASGSSQPAQTAQNTQGQRVNFPQVLHVGRHFDGDTDEINVIVCTQRSRRRHAGELPRCYTFGWRHVNPFEVPPHGKASLMPPRYGQEREAPGYWKERVIGSMEHPTWEGDQDDDAEVDRRPLNYIDKREEWKEGNYVSYGTGSASAFEKIQGMHIPLHSYEAHRRIREDLWSTERVAANIAKQHAKVVKRHMLAEEQRRRAELALTSTISAAVSTSSQPSTSTTTELASEQATPSTTAPSPSASPSASTSTAGVKTATVARERDSSEKPAQNPRPPPPPSPQAVDRRFAPENIPTLPWYQRLWNYQPPPTGWSADERYGHRTYIIPHPVHAAWENLQRSWKLVLTPTWKLAKATKESFANGAQKRFWYEMWDMSRQNGQYKLLVNANKMLKAKVAEEKEKQRLEQEKLDAQLKETQKGLEELEKAVENVSRNEERRGGNDGERSS